MNDWFEGHYGVFLPNGDLMSTTRIAKYWAAEEIATEIVSDKYNLDSQYGIWYFKSKIAQILKKEWFRK